MKKKSLRIIGLTLTVALVITMLAACGGGSNNAADTSAPTDTTTNTDTAAATDTNTAADTTTPAPAQVSGSISISGSSALFPLVNMAAQQFKTDNPDVTMNVAAGGSGTGLNNVLSETVDIGNSDVYANEKLEAADAAKLVDHKVCIIGVSVIVNTDVGATVTNLTKDQLKGIFSGDISNWKDVGGPDESIIIVNRPSSSGTRALFTKWALDGQSDIEGDQSLQTDDSNALLTTVGSTAGTIGYIAFSYLNTAGANINKVSIDGVEANYDNIYNNKYQVWGYEHMYTNGQPNTQTQAFIDYMSTDTMKAQAETLGYGAVDKLNADAANSR